jgi:anaerobic selenocysteine-containing dehydrogenase
VNQYAEPLIEMHPRLAAKLGIADGDWTTAETRRRNRLAERDEILEARQAGDGATP